MSNYQILDSATKGRCSRESSTQFRESMFIVRKKLPPLPIDIFFETVLIYIFILFFLLLLSSSSSCVSPLESKVDDWVFIKLDKGLQRCHSGTKIVPPTLQALP